MVRAAIVVAACCAIGAVPPKFTYPNSLAQWCPSAKPLAEVWWDAQNDFHTNWVVIPAGESPRVRLMVQKPTEPAPLPFAIERRAGEDRHFYGFRESIRVEDGWIVSFDHGEWGGEIWWFAPDGRERYLFSRANLVAFLPTARGLYLATGIAHGTTNEGQIERLARGKGGRWSSRPTYILGSAPGAAIVEPAGTILVATNEQVVRLDTTSLRPTVLLDDAPWGGLYPNSVVATPGGRVFVGMRHGVARVEPPGRSPRVTWLLPNRNFDAQMRVEGIH